MEDETPDSGTWSQLPKEPESPEPPKHTMSRRSFLRNIGGAAAATVVVNQPGAKALMDFAEGVDKPSSVETEQEKIRGSVAIDLVPKDRSEALHEALGEYDRSQEIGILDPNFDRSTIPDTFLEGDSATRATIMVNAMIGSREGHGELVTSVYDESIENLTGEKPPGSQGELLPLQEALSFQEVTDPIENPLGNPMIDLVVDKDKIARMLSEQFAQNPNIDIVGMSFQVGRQRLEYRTREAVDLTRYDYYPSDSDETYYTLEDNSAMSNFSREELNNVGYPVPEGDSRDSFFLPYKTNESGQKVPLEILTEEQYEGKNSQHKQKNIEEFRRTGRSEGVRELVDDSGSPTYRGFVTEAYNEQFAYDNLSDLMDLARQFPDKLFVTAGGNNEDYFFDQRAKLEAEGLWEGNVVLVGTIVPTVGQRNNVTADGCDVYIDGRPDSMSTSVATAKVRAVAEVIGDRIPKGNGSPQERPDIIKKNLLESSYSDPGEYRGVNNDASEYDMQGRYPTRDTSVLKPEYWNFQNNQT